jgi:S-adenosylmethionine synthetase
MGINADTCAVMVSLDKQSPDIAMGVDEDAREGQGDRRRRPGPDVRLRLQRHARTDAAADRLWRTASEPADRGPLCGRSRLAAARQQEPGDVEYDGQPVRIDTVVVSTQHAPEVSNRRFATS